MDNLENALLFHIAFAIIYITVTSYYCKRPLIRYTETVPIHPIMLWGQISI